MFNCIVAQKGKILLIQRSADLRLYPNYWNGMSGFLDDHQSVEDKIREELVEELSIPGDQVESIERGQVLVQESAEYQKTWIVFPILARVKTDQFKLDWEAQGARWLQPTEAKNLNLLPGFEAVLATFF